MEISRGLVQIDRNLLCRWRTLIHAHTPRHASDLSRKYSTRVRLACYPPRSNYGVICELTRRSDLVYRAQLGMMVVRLSHTPAGSAPCGTTSARVRLRRNHEAAGSPSHTEAATWLHLGTQSFLFVHKDSHISVSFYGKAVRGGPPEMNVSKMICAPLKKSPN